MRRAKAHESAETARTRPPPAKASLKSSGFFDAPDGNSIDNGEFVTHMYVNVFGREPDDGGFNFWFGELNSGRRTQTDVLVDMTQSNEFVQLTINAVVDYLIG